MEFERKQIESLVRTAIADYHQAIYPELGNIPIERKACIYRYHRDRIVKDILLNLKAYIY